MYITVLSDSNDVEGLIFEGDKGTLWTMWANGDKNIARFQMKGRPLGFGIYMGQGGTQN